MNHGSLFSGIGGFDLPAQWIGWNNVFHCEINPFGQKILKHYWPNADSYEDIKTTDFTIYRGRIDVLSGGFPCQPFSVAGQRKGAEDDRYLWPEMLRAIDEIRPRWVIGENVAGLVSMVQPEVVETDLESQTNLQGEVDSKTVQEYQQYVVETVCRDLEHLGYSVQSIIVPACAVGAPHRRDRIWFVAHSDNQECNRWSGEGKQEWKETELGRNGIFGATARPGIQQSIADTGNAGIKGNEQQKADDKYRHSLTANATGSGLESRGQTGFREHQKKIKGWLDDRFEQLGVSPSNSDNNGSYGSKDRQGNTEGNDRSETGSIDAVKFEGCSNKANTTYTDGIGLRREIDGFGESKFFGEDGSASYWANFPTQPPVCGGNDGLPYRMDFNAVFEGIDFPRKPITYAKWRKETIKAYGNAVVPQLVYEIFKGIQEIESNH